MNTYKNSIGGSDCKKSTCNAGNLGLISGLGRSPGERNSYSFQHFGLENSMDREPCMLQFMRSQKVGHDWVTFTFTQIYVYIYKDMCVYVYPKIQHIYMQFVLSSQLFDVFWLSDTIYILFHNYMTMLSLCFWEFHKLFSILSLQFSRSIVSDSL